MKKLFFILAVLFCYACTSPLSPPPPGLIPQEKMTHIIFDVHVGEARLESMGLNHDTATYLFKNVEADILKKHQVSKEQFYTSYDYYLENVSELDKIYERVVDSLTVREAIANGIPEPRLKPIEQPY